MYCWGRDMMCGVLLGRQCAPNVKQEVVVGADGMRKPSNYAIAYSLIEPTIMEVFRAALMP